MNLTAAAIMAGALAYAGADADKLVFMTTSPGARFRTSPGAPASRSTADDPEARVLVATEVTSYWVRTAPGWLSRDELIGVADAIDYFTHAVKERPTAFAYASRSKALLWYGRSKEAARDAATAVRLDPASPCAAYCLGASLAQNGDDYDAMLAFARSVRLAQRPQPRYTAIREHRRGMRLDANAHGPDDVLQIDTRCAGACAARGLALASKGMVDDALKELAESLRLDPSIGVGRQYAKRLVMRGMLRGARRDRSRALADLTEAIRVEPGYAEAFLERGELYLREAGSTGAPEDLAAAVRDLEEAARLDPDNEWAEMSLSNAFSQTGDKQRAFWHADRAVNVSRDPNPFVYWIRATSRADLGHFEEAVADYTAAVELDGTLEIVYLGRADARLRLGQGDAALADLDRAIKLADSVTSRLARARALLALGRPDRAESDCDCAIRQNPRCAMAFHVRGQVMIAKRSYKAAITEFSKAIDLDPSSSQLYLDRARALTEVGEFARAMRDLDHIAGAADIRDAVKRERSLLVELMRRAHGASRENGQKEPLENCVSE